MGMGSDSATSNGVPVIPIRWARGGALLLATAYPYLAEVKLSMEAVMFVRDIADEHTDDDGRAEE